MEQDSHDFHNDMLRSSDWPSFLASLNRSHRGRLVAIEPDGDLLLQNPPAKGAPFQGIELSAGHKEQRLVVFTADQTYTIEAPNLIWVVRDDQEELVAVEVVNDRDQNFIIRFDLEG